VSSETSPWKREDEKKKGKKKKKKKKKKRKEGRTRMVGVDFLFVG
jgi:hypothetical protein